MTRARIPQAEKESVHIQVFLDDRYRRAVEEEESEGERADFVCEADAVSSGCSEDGGDHDSDLASDWDHREQSEDAVLGDRSSNFSSLGTFLGSEVGVEAESVLSDGRERMGTCRKGEKSRMLTLEAEYRHSTRKTDTNSELGIAGMEDAHGYHVRNKTYSTSGRGKKRMSGRYYEGDQRKDLVQEVEYGVTSIRTMSAERAREHPTVSEHRVRVDRMFEQQLLRELLKTR
jgi:hypothetical protein